MYMLDTEAEAVVAMQTCAAAQSFEGAEVDVASLQNDLSDHCH